VFTLDIVIFYLAINMISVSGGWNPTFVASDMCQRRLSRLFICNPSL